MNRESQMFDTLLESRSARKTSAGGAVASVTAHSALIAAAVLATAQARVQKHEPAALIRVDYFQPRQIAAPVRTQTADGGAVEARLPKPIDFDFPSSKLPSIDVPTLPSISDRLAPAFPVTKPAGPGRNGVSRDPTGAFQENEVEKPVTLVAGSAAPRYPEVLRSSDIEGRVVAVFVVDERGRAQVDSVRFLGVDNPLFQEAVRAALPRMRFIAAEIAGRKVRQLVQMPFVFTIDR